MKVQVQSIQFSADQKLIDFIQKKMEKLNRFFDRITDVEVYLSLEGKTGQVKDKVAKVKVNVPGTQIVATENSKLFEESVDLAVNSLARQLKKHKEKVKSH